MIPFEHAYEITQSLARPLDSQWCDLIDSSGQILAMELTSRDALPRFDNSGVDGYAVRFEDAGNATESLPIELSVVETIPAGTRPQKRIAPGQASMILTGAALPPGADSVVMKEYTERKNGGVLIRKAVQQGANIRRKAEEYRRGDVILGKGTVITPPVQGLIAALGYSRIRVYRKPMVSMIVTGSELRSPGTKLSAGQIWESNSFALASALTALGIQPSITSVEDNEAETLAAVRQALNNSDAIITSGGISVGEYDYLRRAFEAAGVKERFWQVAQKPGKPVYFGTCGKTRVFGLPGNPVSALVSFYTLVRPALLAMMGIHSMPRKTVRARLAVPLKKKSGRMEFVRMRLQDCDGAYVTEPARGQGSHMLGGLAFADGIFRFPAAATTKRKGSFIEVELLHWSIL